MEISTSSTRHSARASLRAYKRTAGYRALLETTIRTTRRATGQRGGSIAERRARLNYFEASAELERLNAGDTLDEFSGLIRLPDPLAGVVQP